MVTSRFPGHQCCDGAGAGVAGQSVVVDFGDDRHDPAVDRVAVPGQLCKLVEQHLEPLLGVYPSIGERCCSRGHDTIKTERSDKNRTAEQS
jgi:hypothetical protein